MPDYRDAAGRHWEDAELLYNSNRIPNADHLFGLAAECALKAVMLGLGMRLLPSGIPQEKRHALHADAIWGEFCSFAQGRNGAKYAAMVSSVANPFSGWNISQRYEHRSMVSKTIALKHKKDAESAMKVLKEAYHDGVIQ